jgi:hypothetical protein
MNDDEESDLTEFESSDSEDERPLAPPTTKRSTQVVVKPEPVRPVKKEVTKKEKTASTSSSKAMKTERTVKPKEFEEPVKQDLGQRVQPFVQITQGISMLYCKSRCISLFSQCPKVFYPKHGCLKTQLT